MENFIPYKVINTSGLSINLFCKRYRFIQIILPNSLKLSIHIICLSLFILSCSQSLITTTNTQTVSSNSSMQNQAKLKEKKTNFKKAVKLAKNRNIDNLKTTIGHFRIKRDITICKVRPEPSFKRPSFAKLRGGDIVEKIKEKDNWIKVDFGESNRNRVIGWIRNTDVESTRKAIKSKIKFAEAKIKKDIDSPEEQLSPM